MQVVASAGIPGRRESRPAVEYSESGSDGTSILGCAENNRVQTVVEGSKGSTQVDESDMRHASKENSKTSEGKETIRDGRE